MLEPKNRHKEQRHRLLHAHGHGRQTPHMHTATAGTQGSHGRVGALTLHMWGSHSYMCPAQVSSTRNPPAAPEMCQLGLRTMPSWVEGAAALTQTHLGQEPHFQWL